MSRRIIHNGALEIYGDTGDLLLSISEGQTGDMLNIKLKGQIVTESAHDFDDELTACAIVSKRISLDFEEVTHISSMGLSTLLTMQKILDKEPGSVMRIHHVNEVVWNQFREVGFDELLEIETM